MKKTIFAMFLLAGTTLGFANNASKTITTNKASLEKLVNKNSLNIVSVTYDAYFKCTIKATYHDSDGNHGTITVTAATCSQAMVAITNILGQAGL